MNFWLIAACEYMQMQIGEKGRERPLSSQLEME